MELNREEFIRIFAIFKEESREHIQKLNEGFLILEKEPPQPSLLSELFRHAHSIKGSARMMGFSSIEKVAHVLETLLGKIQKGETAIDKAVMSALYRGVDFLGEVIESLHQGKEEREIHFEEILEYLSHFTTPKKEEQFPPRESASPATAKKDPSKKPPVSPAQESPEHHQEVPPPPPPSPTTAESTPPTAQDYRWERRKTDSAAESQDSPVGRRKADVTIHETIRVATKKLDNLMNQIGELLITKIKLDQRLHEVKVLTDLSADVYNKLQHAQKIVSVGGEELTPATLNSFRNLFNKAHQRALEFDTQLNRIHHDLAEDRNQMSLITDELQKDIKKTRMLPFYTAVEVLPRMVRDLAVEEEKEARLEIEGGEVELDKNILENIKDPLIHLIRNAIDHGIERPEERKKKGKPAEGVIRIHASQQGDSVLVSVEDDGNGIPLELIKKAAVKKNLFTTSQLEQMSEHQLYDLIFQPGFSTSKILTDVSGRGVGMDVVKNNIEKLKGLVNVDSKPGVGTTFTMKLPLTMVTLQTLKVQVREATYSIPTSSIESTVEVLPEQIFTLEGQEAITYNQRPIPVVHMEEILELPSGEESPDERKRPVVIMGSAEKRVAFLVDKLVGEDAVVAKPLSSYLERVRNISGATILGNGKVSLILNVSDLIESAQYQKLRKKRRKGGEVKEEAKKTILVIEDSLTTRTLEVSILESAGYEVVAAADGQEGYVKLMNQKCDVIVTDIQMPHMDGFTFTHKVKSDHNYQHIPVILLTSLESPAEKSRGVEVGADAYIVKSSFDQNNLLETIKRLL